MRFQSNVCYWLAEGEFYHVSYFLCIVAEFVLPSEGFFLFVSTPAKMSPMFLASLRGRGQCDEA